MDKHALVRLGESLRRSARGSLLEYLDGTLALLREDPSPVGSRVLEAAREAVAIARGEVPVAHIHHFHCPVCAARRAAKAKSQQRYREKKRAGA